MEHQLSGSWIHDRDDGEDEQVVQPKIKRKRSLRVRPRHTMERPEEKSGNESQSFQRGDSSLLPFQVENKHQTLSRTEPEAKAYTESNVSKHDQTESSSKGRRNLPSRRVANTSKLHASPKSSRLNCMTAPAEDVVEQPRESWDAKVMNSSGTSAFGTKMPDNIQRRVWLLNPYNCRVLNLDAISDVYYYLCFYEFCFFLTYEGLGN